MKVRWDDRTIGRAGFALTLLVILFASLWAPIRFSFAWSEFHWMQRAFDEPFYFWRLATGVNLSDRLFGSLPGAALLELGASFDLVAEAYAAVVPLLVFTGAFLLAKVWEVHPVKRLIWALLLVLSFDLLSGSNQVVYESPPAVALANLIDRSSLLKPDTMNFFIFFRRPEQQSSWIVLFPYLAGLLASFLTWRPRLYAIVCLTTPFLSIIYINVAIVALIVFGLLSVVGIVIYRRPMVLGFALSLVAALLAFAVVLFAHAAAGTTTRGMFLTHEPFLRPSVAYGLIGLFILVIQARRQAYVLTPRHWVALMCFLVPLITLNQQVLTGVAVLPQNWELSGNYICIVIGFAMLVTGRSEAVSSHGVRLRQVVALCVWGGLLAVLVRGQGLNERQYVAPNAQSVAYAKVFEEAKAKVGDIDAVVLPHLWDESLFVTRVPRGANVLGGYNWLIVNSPPVWETADSFESHAAKARLNFAVGFETLARRGVTPDQMRASVDSEIRSGNCWPVLMYFFAIQDCWPTFWNSTSPATSRLPQATVPLVAMYARYLDEQAGSGWDRRVLLITSEPLPPADATDATGGLRNTLVASMEKTVLGTPARAYAYLQSRR